MTLIDLFTYLDGLEQDDAEARRQRDDPDAPPLSVRRRRG